MAAIALQARPTRPRLLAVALLALTLSACAVPESSPYRHLAYQQIAPGARLTLHAPLQIPARTAHVTVQGSWVGRGASETDPYCLFEISTVSESPQWVEADVFEVWKVGRSISPSSDWGQDQPVRLAALGLGLGGASRTAAAGASFVVGGEAGTRIDVSTQVGLGVGPRGWLAGDTPPTQIFYKTRLWLRSASQPQVRLLTCQWDQMTASGAAFARHLTLEEVRQALGQTFSLSLGG